jgi:DNA-directed RNA polymerase subunit RPC12/RpoP
VAKSDRLLVACPQCHAWPMAAGRAPSRWQNPSETIFRCPQCGHRELFNLKSEVANGSIPHRAYEPREARRSGT